MTSLICCMFTFFSVEYLLEPFQLKFTIDEEEVERFTATIELVARR